MSIGEKMAKPSDAVRRLLFPEARFSPELLAAVAAYEEIDFRKILSKTKKTTLAIEGKSGKGLTAAIDPYKSLLISDREMPEEFYLYAQYMDNNQLSFAYKKRIFTAKSRVTLLSHQDMKAGKFIDLSIAYFSQKHPIEAINSKWNGDSDNFHAFKEGLKAGMTAQEAARTTWSGKKYGKLGFGEVNVIYTANEAWVDFNRTATAVSPSAANRI